jgi:hypothetical protein
VGDLWQAGCRCCLDDGEPQLGRGREPHLRRAAASGSACPSPSAVHSGPLVVGRRDVGRRDSVPSICVVRSALGSSLRCPGRLHSPPRCLGLLTNSSSLSREWMLRRETPARRSASCSVCWRLRRQDHRERNNGSSPI